MPICQVRNEEQELEGRLSYRVISTLKFIGPERIEGRQLMPQVTRLQMITYSYN